MSHLGISEYHRVAPTLADPNSIGDCIFWADFTDKNGSVMMQTLSGTNPVTTTGQYIAIMKNKAAGTGPNFDKLGAHVRVRKDDAGNVCMAAGIFGNLDSGENNGNWGGCCGPSGAFSNLSFDGKAQTTIIVEKIGTANITGPNAMYQVRGMSVRTGTTDYRKSVINTQKVMGNSVSGSDSEVTATSSAFGNTNIRCIVTSTTTAGGAASPYYGQAMIYVNGALEDTENLNELVSGDNNDGHYSFDMSRTQAPSSSPVSSFAGVCVGAEMNDNYLAASSFGINHYYGGIYEIIHFAKTLDAYELGLIESYIAEKYNITFS